jgi:hypothetical protein
MSINFYIGKVLNNIDEYKQERIFVRVLGIHNIEDNFQDKTYGIWLENGIAKKSISGDIPDIDDFVYIIPQDEFCQTGIYLGVVRHQIK